MVFDRQRCRGLLALAAGIPWLLALLLAAPSLGADSASDLAAERYRYARLLLEDLSTVPGAELGEEQYLLVIDAFQKVHRTSPASSYCDDALLQAAHLFREMIGRFGSGPYQQKAVAAYEFLIREYPHSKLLDLARQSVDEINRGIAAPGRRPDPPAEQEGSRPVQARQGEPSAAPGLTEPTLAVAATEKPPVRQAAAMGADPAVAAILASRSLVLPVGTRPQASRRRGTLGQIEGVRFWTHPDYTRVVIELSDRVDVSYDQLPHPRRLFFNLLETRLGGQLEQESTFEVGDSFLKRIRVAQFAPRSTRVVFDLERTPYFDVSWLSNPPRLVVEVRETDEPVLLAGTPPAPAPAQTEAQAGPGAGPELTGKTEPAATANTAATSPASTFARVLDLGSDSAEVSETAATSKTPETRQRSDPAPPPVTAPPVEDTETTAKAAAKIEPPKSADPPKSQVVEEAPIAAAERPSASETGKVEMAKATPPPLLDLPPPKPAAANGQGQRNLIRALGLKVSRVVIDAGHGGHDPGTIGPSGLREKDLVLDIAMRLGKLIEEGLGSEVLYTRNDDRFLSHKERTNLANESKADLFISIHANSARSRQVRGVETYYLNFTTDAWALAVASRENAASDRPVHELQDLISKIALKEKIEESREFATRVQSALHGGLSNDDKGLRNRGVRKAPFLVLIGAKMPAVLAEIGFISNAETEKLLKSSSYRQKVANHLYQGMLTYSESLGTVSMARSETPESK